MKVSIIIPVYNAAAYVKRCLESVCAQTYQDIECILIDDYCTDNSMEIAREIIKSHTGSIHFLIISQDRNLGQAEARNKGFVVATGDYLYFLDSDDAITTDCIDRLARLAQKYPAADFIQGNLLHDGTDKLRDSHFRCIAPEYCNQKDELERLILCGTVVLACSRLIKRSFLVKHRLLFQTGILHEDVHWIYFLAKHAQSAAFTNEATYLYYNNGDSVSNSPSVSTLIKRYTSLKWTVEAFVGDMMQAGSSSRWREQYVLAALVACLRLIPAIGHPCYWLSFWWLVCHTYSQLRLRPSWSKLAILLAILPPMCFLSACKGGIWRIQHFLIPRI